MTDRSGLRRRLLLLVIPLVLCAGPVRAERPVFMSSFDAWQTNADAGADTLAIAISPDGRHVYVGRDYSYYISHFDRDAVTGDLTWADDVASSFAIDPACAPDENGIIVCHSAFLRPQQLALSGDGRHLYACIAGRIVTYARDAANGNLTEGDSVASPCRHLTVSDDGTEMYAASYGHVDILTRDALTGSLTYVQGVGFENVDLFLGVAASHDGQNIYVADRRGQIGVLRRDGATFVFEELIDDGIDIPEALHSSAEGLVVSTDDEQVYVAVMVGYAENPRGGALVAFDRAPATGRLTVQAIYENNAEMGNALWTPRGVVASGDGTRVLVEDQYAMALFARGVGTGVLTFLGREDPYCVRVGSFRGAVITSDGLDIYANAIGGRIVNHQRPPGRVMHYRVEGLSCPASPVEDGETATTSAMTIKNDGVDDHDQLKWDWTGMDSTGTGSFGSTGQGFAVCVYTDSGSGPALAYESFAPAGNCWEPIPDGLDFSPASSDLTVQRVNARVTRAKLKSKRTSAGVRQKIRVQSKKLNTIAPQLPLANTGPTRVQLLRSDGRAWEASYGASEIRRNDGIKFNAKR